MNYYEHHLGDYAEATAHLSFIEDAAYSRLMRKTYATEAPLPADIKAVQRLVGARTKDERDAVAVVLEEFFDLRDDGWHNVRCDDEIAKYQKKASHNREVGKLGGRPRKTETQTVPNQEPKNNPVGFETEPKHNPPQSPDTNSHSSSLRSEESAAQVQCTPSRPKREEITLAKYLETCKAAGIKPVPDDHAIRAWCVDAKIPTDMLQVAWVVFRERYTGDEKLKNKRYKDWPGHFANSVKDRWHGLWFIGEDGAPAWTSTGLQRKQVLEAQHAKAQQQGVDREHA